MSFQANASLANSRVIGKNITKLHSCKLSHSIPLAIPRRMEYFLFDNLENDNMVELRVAGERAFSEAIGSAQFRRQFFDRVFVNNP